VAGTQLEEEQAGQGVVAALHRAAQPLGERRRLMHGDQAGVGRSAALDDLAGQLAAQLLPLLADGLRGELLAIDEIQVLRHLAVARKLAGQGHAHAGRVGPHAGGLPAVFPVGAAALDRAHGAGVDGQARPGGCPARLHVARRAGQPQRQLAAIQVQGVGARVVGELGRLVEGRSADVLARRLEAVAIDAHAAAQLAQAGLARLAQQPMQRVPVERGVGTAAQHQRALEYAVLQATLGQQLGAAAPVRAEPVQRHDAGQRFHGRGRRHGTLGLPGQALARRVERKGDEGQIGLGQPMRLHQLAHRGGDGRGVRRNACAGAQERDEKRGQQGRQAAATGSCRQGGQ
jgi:hypothetical protein